MLPRPALKIWASYPTLSVRRGRSTLHGNRRVFKNAQVALFIKWPNFGDLTWVVQIPQLAEFIKSEKFSDLTDAEFANAIIEAGGLIPKLSVFINTTTCRI